MIERLHIWWVAARDSLWLVPAAMIAVSIALALGMVELSTIVDRDALKQYSLAFGAGAESSREMLSTIAGAMMTVTSVTFSITMVAVTQASSQYTSRVLRNFMRDRTNQVVLGTFTSVFVYCLVVLRTVRGNDDGRFIPALAVLGAFVLAIVAIGVLVVFIHHATVSLQASSILSRIGRDTSVAIARLFPDDLGSAASGNDAAAMAQQLEDAFIDTVRSPHTGYLLEVNGHRLLQFAAEHDLVVRMERDIGEHVVKGAPLAAVTQPLGEEGKRRLANLYIVGQHRTLEQDAGFGLEQMADVAVKALSPGVNGTSTAIIALDNIAGVLALLASRRVDDPHRLLDGRLRVIARGPTFQRLVDTGLDEIRRNAGGNVRVLQRLLEIVAMLRDRTTSPSRLAVLEAHARSIRNVVRETVRADDDRQRLERVASGLVTS